MDQLKEILRQAIKYRFWIAVGISALLPLVAYFIGSSKIRAEAATKKNEIEGAHKAVKEYANGNKPNDQYKPIVDAKKDVLTNDVNAAWKKLHARQAPLLTWPSDDMKFTEWGRKWPEGVDLAAVQLEINKYINAYPDYVVKVYNKCNPWDPEKGTGIVVAPPKDALLQPSQFDVTDPPNDLGKIWSAQEKLWVESALLEVVAQVNKSAKNWDSAVIKQINDLQVANAGALDQVAIAKGETLKDAPTLTPGGEAAPAASKDATATDASSAAAGAETAYSAMGSQGSGSQGYGMGGMMGAANTMTVSYLSSSNDQYQVVPVSMSVLIDQNSVANLLVALANSPMSIQVIDFDQSRPPQRVTKPEKGEALNFGGFGGAYGGYRGGMGQMGEMMFNSQMGMNYGRGRMGAGEMSAMGGQMYGGGGYGGYGGATTTTRTGKSRREHDVAKEKEEKQKARKTVEVKIHDPYYNIIEVTIWGQARFYNTPPAETPAESQSPGETADSGETKAAGGEASSTATEPAKSEGAEPSAASPKAEGAKAETPKPDAKAETPKADAKAEAPKTDSAAETPKPDAKAESPKAKDQEETPKAETPKAESKAESQENKAQAPKPEGDSAAPKA